MSAEELSVESFHGLIEVVQNADDLHAREVRVGYRPQAGCRELLIVDDGVRVLLHHVIAMTLAFVSTKRDDPRAKGRFGIGLKTVGRLGETLTVHCEPYHFTIEGNQVRAASSARSIAGLFDARSAQTLFRPARQSHLLHRQRQGDHVYQHARHAKKVGAETRAELKLGRIQEIHRAIVSFES
jgi:Histidine kinase-, DNA gyrase B-, and HSP90-like ATPase